MVAARLRTKRLHPRIKEHQMLDLLMAAFTAGFFILALAYVKACEHLR